MEGDLKLGSILRSLEHTSISFSQFHDMPYAEEPSLACNPRAMSHISMCFSSDILYSPATPSLHLHLEHSPY